MSTNLERKNNLPIGNDRDEFPSWDEKRFIYYTMPFKAPNMGWCMFKELGGYRCVNSMGQLIPNSNIRVMIKGNQLKLKIVYRGELLKTYDIYLEETLPLSNEFTTSLRYKNLEIIDSGDCDYSVPTGYSSVPTQLVSGLKTFIDKESVPRYMLSLKTERSNAERVDIVIVNVTKGVARHVPRSNIKDLIPSVITIPTKDINSVIDEIGEEWRGDELVIRLYVHDHEPLKFKYNDFRHDVYLSRFGATEELIDNIIGVAQGLEKTMELGSDDLAVTDIHHLNKADFLVPRPSITLVELFGNNEVPCVTSKIGDVIKKGNGMVNTWRTVEGVEVGAVPMDGEMDRPSIPYSVFMMSNNEFKDVTNDSTIVKTTDGKLSSTMSHVNLAVLIKGCARFEQGHIGINDSTVEIEGPLLKFVEIKLNKEWLRPGVDFTIFRNKVFFIKPVIKKASFYTLITYGNEPWSGDFKNLNAITPDIEFPEIAGAHPDDIVIVNNRRYRYEDIVGRGVVAHQPYSFFPLHDNVVTIKSKHGTALVYSAFRHMVCEWLAGKSNKEIYNVTLKELTSNKRLMKLYKVQQRIRVNSKFVYFDFTTNMRPIKKLGSKYNEAVTERSEQLFKEI